jgi:CheY-like chemotaxis protein/two-component sensor histidine kinase
VRDRLPKESRDRQHLEKILNAGLRGRELVREMLTFSRRAEQEKKPLRLADVVAETAGLIRAAIPTTIDMKIDIQDDSGLVLADPTQMQQLLMNLLTNAAHAMRDKGGRLGIELSDYALSAEGRMPNGVEPGYYMKLVVRDTGVGMSDDTVLRIFDPFFTTKKPGEGTGLGLSVVHGIVTQSNGHISVESEPDKGSAFTVLIPKIGGKSTTGRTGKDLPTGSERILLVDDEEAVAEMGEDILAELGYEVTSRTTSVRALSLFNENPYRFDLVITDQTMPDISGIELSKRLLSLRSDIPIIMSTGFSDVVDAEKAKRAGIRNFIMKPLTKSELAHAVRQALDEKE